MKAVESAAPPTPSVARARFVGSPPVAPRRARPPPLMIALDIRDALQCTASVEAVLKADAEAALFPFMDHGWEPPLCYAVRHTSSIEAIRLLIDHGADVNAADARGETPFKLLGTCVADSAWTKEVEKLLVAAGATVDGERAGGCNPPQQKALDVAWLHNSNLARFVEGPPVVPPCNFNIKFDGQSLAASSADFSPPPAPRLQPCRSEPDISPLMLPPCSLDLVVGDVRDLTHSAVPNSGYDDSELIDFYFSTHVPQETDGVGEHVDEVKIGINFAPNANVALGECTSDFNYTSFKIADDQTFVDKKAQAAAPAHPSSSCSTSSSIEDSPSTSPLSTPRQEFLRTYSASLCSFQAPEVATPAKVILDGSCLCVGECCCLPRRGLFPEEKRCTLECAEYLMAIACV